MSAPSRVASPPQGFFICLYKEMAAWTIDDPIVVNGVKTAKLTGYAQELDAFDLS